MGRGSWTIRVGTGNSHTKTITSYINNLVIQGSIPMYNENKQSF